MNQKVLIPIVVYYLEQVDVFNDGRIFDVPKMEMYESNEMTIALNRCQELRKEGKCHVSMSCENVNSIGKPGVDSIIDGKTPDGVPYTWMKRRSQ